MGNSDSKVFVEKGLALINSKNYEEAIESYNKAIELDPNDAKAYNNKGNALRNLKRFEEALECYDQSIKLDNQFSAAYNNKGLALRHLKRFKDALECCNTALDLDDKIDAKAYNNKGLLLDDLGMYKEAIECYDKALEIDQKFLSAYNNKGNTLRTLKEKQNAIACYDKAIEIDSTFIGAYTNKATVLKSMKKYLEAIECYDYVLEIYPYNLSVKESRQKLIDLLAKGRSTHSTSLGNNFLKNLMQIESKDDVVLQTEYNIEIKDKIAEYDKDIHDDIKNETQDDNKEVIEIINEQKNVLKTQNSLLIELPLINHKDIKMIHNKTLSKNMFSKVLLAKFNKEEVAIRQIKTHQKSKKLEDNIIKELNKLNSINHPNLLNLIGYSLHDKKFKLAMEYCKGDSLFNLLHDENFSLSIRQKLLILIDTAKCLQHLHENNIIHTNFKSSNVLILEDVSNRENIEGRITAKVSDTGKVMKQLLEMNKKNDNSNYFNSAQWTAPEVLKGGEHSDKSDVYSFAVYMWEIFSERVPYRESKLNQIQIGVMVASKKIRPKMGLLLKQTPEEVRQLIVKCWAELESNRPEMREVVEVLKRLI